MKGQDDAIMYVESDGEGHFGIRLSMNADELLEFCKDHNTITFMIVHIEHEEEED